MDIQILASSSKGNCYKIDNGQEPLLLECGISFKLIQQGLKFRTSEIAGCLLSHGHQDHCKAAKEIMKAGIDIYCSRGTAEALGISGHRLKVVKSKQQFKIGSWDIMPFDAVHDAKEPFSFLMASGKEKCLFATDTAYIRYKFRNLNYIMVECNYDPEILQQNVESGAIPIALKNRLLHSHFGLENVKEFLKANDLFHVQEIYLLHMSDGNSDAEKAKRQIQELTRKPVYIA